MRPHCISPYKIGPEPANIIRYSFVPFVTKIYEKGGRAFSQLVSLVMSRRWGSIYVLERYKDTCCGDTQK